MSLQSSIASIEACEPEDQAAAIQVECIAAGGVWATGGEGDNALFEISLHGVTGTDLGEQAATRSWLKAAKTVAAHHAAVQAAPA